MPNAESLARVRASESLTDHQLAARAARGDGPAFAAIMRRHNRLLFRTARSILKSDVEAEDALQEAYLRAWRAIDGFRSEAKLSTWLARIVINESLARLRRGRGAQVIPLDNTGSEPDHDPKDVQIVNTALGAELEAIAAYQVGAQSNLLQKPALDLALTFQGHHKEHADLLDKTIEKLGGKAVAAKAAYDFPVAQLKSQADVLRFAAKLEQGAVSAYLGAVPLFANRDLSKAAASILGDEAMHWAVLRQAVGEVPVPSAFVA